MVKFHGTTSSKNIISVSGSLASNDVSPENASNFTSNVVVLSFESVSNPGVSYSFPGSFAGTNGGINKTIIIPANVGIPSGQYNLTVRLPNNKIAQIPVNVG